jgi:hypothetical protein
LFLSSFLALARVTLFFLASSLLGEASRLFLLRLLSCCLFFNATAVVGLDPLALLALGFETVLLALLRLFGLASLLIDLVLLQARLLLEDITIDIGPLRTDLDIHGARTALAAGEPDFLLGFAIERNPAGRGIAALTAAVAAAQMSEELQLGVIADAIVRAGYFDACLVELHEQPIDRHLQYLGKLRNGYFCHRRYNLTGASLSVERGLRPFTTRRQKT